MLKKILTQFWKFHKQILKKNEKYKNIHQGETCIIMSNGGSLKYYDISKSISSKLPIIVCTYNLLDNRLRELDVRYCAWPEPYSLYPLFYNDYPFVQKIQKNKIKKIFKHICTSYPQVQFFINLTNFYALWGTGKNLNYFHHLGNKTNIGFDLAGSFGESAGALDTMLGMAKYFGFSKAILVGCDYLGSPPMMGHFYADSNTFSGDYMRDYCLRIKKVSEGIDVTVILPNGASSPDFNFASYENFFGIESHYLDNNILVDDFCLDWLRDAANSDQAIMRQEVK